MKRAKVLFGGVPGMVAEDCKKMERYLLEEYPKADFYFYGEQTVSKAELLQLAKDAQVLISWDQKMDHELYSKLNLIAYCAASIGFDAANVDAATKNGVYVANVPDYCTHEVATHTISLIFSLYRKFYKMIDYVKEGNWDLTPMDYIRRFENSTLGLLGFGRIPAAIAKKLSGFHLNILAYDPFVDDTSMNKYGVKKVDFETILKESDYLSLHLPLTESTKHIINQENIKKMKEGVYLINTARGALIDEQALYKALRSKKITAAALDVLSKEPPSDIGKKIIGLDNTIVTGHCAYVSLEASDAQIRMTAQNVASFLSGKIPENTINLKNIVRRDVP